MTPAPVKAAEAAVVPVAVLAPVVAAPLPATIDVAGVLANVAMVNTAVGVSGGVEQARKVAETVRACGSVDAFLQHLDLVAQLRGTN